MMDKQAVQALAATSPIRITKAFSLIEVSLVVFLIALFMAVSLPIFTGSNQRDLKNLTSQFVNLVNQTRDGASTTNQPHFLYLDAVANRIFVFQEETELADFMAKNQEELATLENAILVQKIHPSLSIDSITYNDKTIPSVSIRFDPSGFSEIFKITFTNKENSMSF